MHRRLFAACPVLAVLLLPCAGLPAHAATSCAAGNPNTTSVSESTPAKEFTVNANGTVTHKKTGLIWKQCAEGSSGAACGTGRAAQMTWANALKAANSANSGRFAGYADWRLANKKELESIVERCGYDPAISATVFPATPAADFWSGSSFVPVPVQAWSVSFYSGYSNVPDKTASHFARLVRGGQSADAFDGLSPSANVFYNGNGSTGGAVPNDGTTYAVGATVTVSGNTGSLTRTGATFAGWSADSGGGVMYAGGATFPIVGDVTLYAQWNASICTLDVDGNSSIDALTDGLMIIRAMFGLTGTAVTDGAVGGGATRPTWAQIQPYLNGNCGTNFAP